MDRHRVKALGANDIAVAGDTLQRLTQELFGQRTAIVPSAIDIGGVDIVHAVIQRGGDDLSRQATVHSPAPLAAGAQRHLRHPHP